MEAFLYNNIAFHSIDIYISEKSPKGERSCAVPMNVSMRPVKENSETLPSLRLPKEFGFELLQSIVDEAAKLGILPKEVQENKRVAQAFNDHLQDMRRIVFKNKE